MAKGVSRTDTATASTATASSGSVVAQCGGAGTGRDRPASTTSSSSSGSSSSSIEEGSGVRRASQRRTGTGGRCSIGSGGPSQPTMSPDNKAHRVIAGRGTREQAAAAGDGIGRSSQQQCEPVIAEWTAGLTVDSTQEAQQWDYECYYLSDLSGVRKAAVSLATAAGTVLAAVVQ